MGDARRLKKKYIGPGHPWQKTRIEEEKKLKQKYGLKNKKEIWKLNSRMKNYADTAKKLIAATGPQAEKEKTQLFSKLKKLGLISQTAKLDDILGLTIIIILYLFFVYGLFIIGRMIKKKKIEYFRCNRYE